VTVAFRGTDGVDGEGTFVPAGRPGRAPLVVLVHEYRGGPEQWRPLVALLHRAGFASFRFGLRKIGELDESVDARDVRGALSVLSRQSAVDSSRVAVVGAGVGASTASWVVGMRPDAGVRAAVGLSPVDGAELLRAGRRGEFHPHDLLVIADREELQGGRFIARGPGGSGVTLRTARSTGHGTALLRDPEVRRGIVDWLRRRLT
jgi:alpha-beta hydrolase superfamily lysophospholipase